MEDESQAMARAFFLTGWSGGRYMFDRVTRATLPLEDVRLSIIGSIQPGPLSAIVRRASRDGGMSDGLLQRFVIAWPDDPGELPLVDRLPDAEAKRRLWDVFECLDALDPERIGAVRDRDWQGELTGPHYLRLAPDALGLFNEWRLNLDRRMRSLDQAALEEALSKFRTHAAGLALALHVVDGGTGPVSRQATCRALALAEYFESHARRAYGAGRRDEIDAAHAILRRIAKRDLDSKGFLARDVYRPQWSKLGDRETVQAALETLVAHRYLDEFRVDTGGRPTTCYALTAGACRE
jgi:putative DNA primase/helicase